MRAANIIKLPVCFLCKAPFMAKQPSTIHTYLFFYLRKAWIFFFKHVFKMMCSTTSQQRHDAGDPEICLHISSYEPFQLLRAMATKN